MWQVAHESKIQLVSCKLSPKSLLGLSALEDIHAINMHIFCHSLWSVPFSDVLYILINMYVCVPANVIIQSVWFQTICDKMILRSKSEAHLWFMTITFITLIIRVALIEGWFIIDLLHFMLLKAFLSWGWNSTMNAPWLRNISLSLFLTEFPKFK